VPLPEDAAVLQSQPQVSARSLIERDSFCADNDHGVWPAVDGLALAILSAAHSSGGFVAGPLRIMHVVESLDRGGLERVVCDLVLEQKRQGHAVEVFCIFSPGAFAPELRDAGINVSSAGKTRGPDLATLLALRAAVRRSGARVIHTHNPVANYYSCAAELTSWRRLPIVNTRHNMGASNPKDRREKLFRISLARTAKVAMVSPQVSGRFVNEGIVSANKAEVVMNGIPLDRYVVAQASSRGAARELLGIDADAFVFGSVGRLVRVKNHQLLLAAAASMCRSDARVKIVLLGNGELRDALARQADELGIAKSVLLLGERADIPKVLPAFDIFVMPSRSEGHSIALLEAAATGLPVIATNVGGNPEIVQNGVTGALVPSEDEAAMRGAMERLQADAPARIALASKARLWAEQTISVAAMSGSYERIYREVCAASSA
jgi:glycosyltransferase involved in cell wall biosynthesis